MKTTTALSSLLFAAAPLVTEAHYIFSQLIVNGTPQGKDYTYIRKNSNSYQPSFTNEVINSPDLRCNKGAKAGSAQTYTVKAGDKVGFKLWFNENIEHPGPGFVYMSKAPGSVNSYEGDGDWFKVAESGLCGGGKANTDAAWCTWQKDRIEYTIPKTIPPGEYLVRVEHIAIHESHVGKAQFYMECAQLKVEGPGGGVPGPLVKIPGMYKAADPGIAYNKWTPNPAPYIMPGPAVWTDGATSTKGELGAADVATAEDLSACPAVAPSAEPEPAPAPAADENACPAVAEPAAPAAPAAPAPAPAAGGDSGAKVALYGQCGGQGYSGPTACAQGTCKFSNDWYSQCV
ncbi:uncharacterized protein PG986_002728 [Apiospora aurea]|uniref:lytic cellulose monooxygenase (C4-dehydrogenating) n=1 Tax=Apiospora aurea TaxID=335848 RepID=A0ABR1QQ43_9PEZI